MANASEAELQAELFQLIADAQTTNYLTAAALTVAVLELAANFEDEQQLWMRYFSLVTVTIYASFMFREVKSDHAEAVTSSLVGTTADMILCLRQVTSQIVWVLYGKSRRLLYIFVPFLIAEFIVEVVVGIFTILPLGQFFHIGQTEYPWMLLFESVRLSVDVDCLATHHHQEVPRYFTYYAVPFTTMSFVMFCMTLYKCGLTMFEHRAVKMPLISLFLRDGVFWFLTIFAISIAELFVWARGRPSLAQSTVSTWTILNAIVGARILLNLKKFTTVGPPMPTEEFFYPTENTFDI
ncbi:hypothetical protein C8R46DRAFT_1219061 [Mycena filopes]|nr:hypothetical protein C8R46DRAFT_1219061 [Mycena filopes]